VAAEGDRAPYLPRDLHVHAWERPRPGCVQRDSLPAAHFSLDICSAPVNNHDRRRMTLTPLTQDLKNSRDTSAAIFTPLLPIGAMHNAVQVKFWSQAAQ